MSTVTVAPAVLKLVVAVPEQGMRVDVCQALEENFGYAVLEQVRTGTALQRAVLEQEPDIVLFDVRLPGINGLEALRQIYQVQPVPAVALCEQGDRETVQSMLLGYSLSYVLKPYEAHHLDSAIRVVRARWEVVKELTQANAALRQELHNRKLIERAKGVLMKRYRWSENEAYQRLQRSAMNRRISMRQLAEAVLNGTEFPGGESSRPAVNGQQAAHT
jgi:response regulator NasT